VPIVALLIIGLQIFCGVHAARNGHLFPWIFIIIFAPLIGCAIYIIMIMAPEMQRAGAKAATTMTKVLDPDRDYRARVRQVEMVGSADAKKALAEECIKRSEFAQAAEIYESAAVGIHADDPALLHGLARARFLNSDPAGAQQALDALRAANPDWVSPDAHLLYARALEGQGKTAEALEDYEALTRYFPGEEARCRYALLLQKEGRVQEARAIFEEVVKSVEGAPKHYRRAQHDWLSVARRNLGR
jgi:hypothetical protein